MVVSTIKEPIQLGALLVCQFDSAKLAKRAENGRIAK